MGNRKVLPLTRGRRSCWKMKRFILILAVLTITNISFGQSHIDSICTEYPTRSKWLALFEKAHIDSIYSGLQEICWNNGKREKQCYTDPTKPKRKWYHLTTIAFSGDSVFVKQSPVSINKKDTLYSASDGGFYYYTGIVIKNNKNVVIINLTETHCDYCTMPTETQEDGKKVERRKTFIAAITTAGLTINKQQFRRVGMCNFNKRL